MNRETAERLVELGYRAGMANGIREYAVWKDGGQFVGVMRRPLREILASLAGTPSETIRRAALSNQQVADAVDLATREV